MYALIAVPSTSEILSNVSQASNPVFSELLPLAYLLLGFIIGGLVINFVVKAVLRGIGKLTGRGRRVIRRRR